MVLENELDRQQQRIFFFASYFEVLSVKLYFEKHKTFETEYEENENNLSVLLTQVKLDKIKATLDYLTTEFQQSMECYVKLIKEQE